MYRPKIVNTNKEAMKYLTKYFKAVRLLNKALQQAKNCNTPDVSSLAKTVAVDEACPHFDTCINGGKNEFCDLQTFNEVDCFMLASDR